MGTEPVSSVDSQGRVDLVIYQQLEIFSFFPTSVVALAATDFGVRHRGKDEDHEERNKKTDRESITP